MVDARKIVLLGPPGSGKGTQAEILGKELGLPAISTGDMLREAVAAGNELGKRVEGIMSAGALVDDDTMGEVVRERLARDEGSDGFILDGYPRTLPQAGTLESILAVSQEDLDAVVQVDVPEEELVARALARGRSDDSEAVVRERLRVYREKTEPLVDYYDRRGLLRRIDGVGAIDDVTGRIREVLR